MQRGFTPILIVLLIGIVGAVIGGAYYFGYDHGWEKSIRSQTPQTSPAPSPIDETVYTEATRSANWKTYTNNKYGFQLKYPEDELLLTSNIWTPFIPSNEPLHFENLYTQRSYPGGPDSIDFSIAVYAKDPTTSLTKWLSKDIQDLKKAKRRSVDEVLNMAYAGETGIFY